ncbi:unnamed protein product [Mytilus coruscus]|uniref:CCHC-type domain-containing protein n=1 Tax=Mytilus coruscus TaxID=42192 RepID=A0A6J8A2H5_MYTCO|nr:unnamed protein product [Mytilus coruscus]
MVNINQDTDIIRAYQRGGKSESTPGVPRLYDSFTTIKTDDRGARPKEQTTQGTQTTKEEDRTEAMPMPAVSPIQREELHQTIPQTDIDTLQKDLDNLKNKMSEKSSGMRKPGWKSKLPCFNCVKLGHFKSECRTPKNQYAKTNKSTDGQLCHCMLTVDKTDGKKKSEHRSQGFKQGN